MSPRMLVVCCMLAVAFAGCAVTPSAAQLQTIAETPAKKPTGRNPFRELADRKATPKPLAETKAPPQATAPREPETRSTAGTEPAPDDKSVVPAGRTYSRELLKQINEELADADPQEREEWFRQLKQLEPSMIPEVLRARRLTQQVVKQRSAPAVTPAEWSQPLPTPVIRPASQNYVAGETPPAAPPASHRPAAPTERVAYRAAQPVALQTPLELLPDPRTPLPAMPYQPGQPLRPREEATATGSRAGQLESLIALAERELAQTSPAEKHEYTRRHVWLRVLYLMAGRQERALAAIPGIDAADQEFWQMMLWGMANYFDDQHLTEDDVRIGQTLAQIQTAVRRLQEKAPLELRNVSFCQQIDYFGNYERFPRDEFRPGDEVLVYAEIEHFKSELSSDGRFRTHLRSTLEILSPTGELRKRYELPATEDLCRSPRRDYFHNYQFAIPERLPLGPHVLKLTVVDELSSKLATTTLKFIVK